MSDTASHTDLNIAALESALAHRIVGGRILHYDCIGSTMDEARRLIQQGAAEGAVVIAEEQTAGRGRFNRSWVSPRSENLSFSVVLMPTASQLPYMNMAATLSVAQTLADCGGLQPTIKWPNDVRIDGRKICGILIETAIESDQTVCAIIGIGLNINFDPSMYAEIAHTSTSLYCETGRKHNRTPVLQSLLEHLDDEYRTVRQGGSLTHRWASQLDTLGRKVQLKWQGGVIEGVAESVDERGNLLVRQDDGSLYTAAAGEVTSQV